MSDGCASRPQNKQNHPGQGSRPQYPPRPPGAQMRSFLVQELLIPHHGNLAKRMLARFGLCSDGWVSHVFLTSAPIRITIALEVTLFKGNKALAFDAKSRSKVIHANAFRRHFLWRTTKRPSEIIDFYQKIRQSPSLLRILRRNRMLTRWRCGSAHLPGQKGMTFRGKQSSRRLPRWVLS